MRSGLLKEATLVGGALFLVGAALMQFRVKGITDKKNWPYLGVFIAGFSAHLIFEAIGLNKKYCEYAFESEPEEWGEDVEWDENFKRKKEEEWIVDWDAESDSKEEARLKKYEKTYGKEGAKVRNRIFKRILANKQGGTKAGQWSARKAQSLTEDYEKAMKGKNKKPYKSSKKTKSQKDLKDWGDQKWTTKSGKKSSKTGERYLPEKAIKALSDKEYKETSDKKRKDTKKGKQFSKQPKKVAEKVKKYRAEMFEAEGKPTSVEVKRSTNDEKKLMAVFTYPDGKTKTTHFGQRGASDYTKHGEKERMERYLERHGGGTTTSTKEDWKDPTTAGALSRWILWNKPSLSASFNDFKKRFNLKGDLKVKKSAETFESETVAFESFRGRWNVGQTRDIEGVRVKKMRNDFYRLDFQGESTIIRDGEFFEINRNDRGGFSRGRYDRTLNRELRRSHYSEKDVPDNMEAIIRWKHRVGGGRLVIRRPFKKARAVLQGGLYHFRIPGERYDGVFYQTPASEIATFQKYYNFLRKSDGERKLGRFPKKNEAWLDIRYDAETFDSDTYITRKNRRTGNKVSLVAPGIEASEDEGWMLICEKHSAVATFETRQQAERHFAYPDQWCEYCMGYGN